MTIESQLVKLGRSVENMSMPQGIGNKTVALEPLGRRERKALAVRQDLFEAGLAAFERQPIGLVSVLDITEAADVAKGVFYLQFKSKDDYLLALLEEVQNRFLSLVRESAVDSRSKSARIAAAVQAFDTFVQRASTAARFWARMSSYFPDEIGEPGHLALIRQAYLQQLAALISGKTITSLSEEVPRAALIVDTICRAAVTAEVQTGKRMLDTAMLVKVIRTALHSSQPITRANVTKKRVK